MTRKPKVKKLYNSLNDDIVKDFYLETLVYFKNYDRVSAYFDSKVLSLYSKGIENIVYNNGKIRFIFSHQITEKDYDMIIEGYKKRITNEIENNILDCIYDLKDNDNISNLAYLIEKGFVDVKIALTKQGVFHDKFGLIYDDVDTVLFRGSANETKAAIDSNYDSFETTCSWLSNDEIISIRKENFERLWNNKEKGVEVIDAPEALINKLLKYNKGKLIVPNLDVDSIILDYDNRFYSENNLTNKDDFDEKSFKFRFINNYTSKIIGNKRFYKDQKNYLTIEKIIKYYKDVCKYFNVKLHITNNLIEFIESRKYEMDRMKSLGIAIKENKIDEIESLSEKYSTFNRIVSRDMERVLRKPQLIGAFHIAKMRKSSNFSVPGSGKTSIVYGAFSYLNSKEVNKVDKIVMIGPLNSFNTWKEEFKLNFGNKKTLKVLDLSQVDDVNKSIKLFSSNNNLILINYEKLPSIDKDELFKELINSRTLLVFDEIHRIKNTEGIRAKIALKLSKLSNYKVALTGTPIPNGYQDIYNILNILYTDEYKTFFGYRTNNLIEANNNLEKAKKINEDIYPFFMRTTKKDLSIPLPNEDDLSTGYIEMDGKEKKLFEIIHKTYSSNSLLLYIRLLQATINPRSVLKELETSNEFKEMFSLDEKSIIGYNNFTITKSEKEYINNFGLTRKFFKGIELIKDLVKQGKKVLVWCVFVDTIDLINDHLNNLNIANDKIYGSTSIEDRNTIIERFKNGKTSVLISNPHTIAESISLHKTCHDAIYFEYTFNLTHMLQSRDRINRLGLPDNQYTQYYYLMINSKSSMFNSIDYLTYDRLKNKEKLMIDAIENNNISYVSSGTIMDDLDYIFNKNKKRL